jgi:hypothetical protein
MSEAIAGSARTAGNVLASKKARGPEIFAQRGYELPDTPMMAFHRGDISQLEKHRDPRLTPQVFAREIYPSAADDGRAGVHWTPIDGATLLHSQSIFVSARFDWLLRAALMECPRCRRSRRLRRTHAAIQCRCLWALARYGIDRHATGAWGPRRRMRAQNLRKFLDWIETPHWHEARDVTAAEWGRGFPETG